MVTLLRTTVWQKKKQVFVLMSSSQIVEHSGPAVFVSISVARLASVFNSVCGDSWVSVRTKSVWLVHFNLQEFVQRLSTDEEIKQVRQPHNSKSDFRHFAEATPQNSHTEMLLWKGHFKFIVKLLGNRLRELNSNMGLPACTWTQNLQFVLFLL